MKGTRNFRLTRFWYFHLPAVLLLVVLTLSNLAQNDRSKLQSRKQKLEQEISEMNRELELTKQNKSANLNQLLLIKRKISKREELINAIDQEVDGIDSQVNSLSDTIYRINRDLTNLRKEYAGIIYSTYRNRSAYDRMMFIFASRNFNQAYKRIKYLQQYTEFRKRQVKSISETQMVLASRKLELENRKSSKLTLKHSQERERNVLADEKQQQDDKIKNLSAKEKKLLSKLHENEVALNKLQSAIEKLVADEIRKANEEKARKAAIAEAERKTAAEAEKRAKARADAGKKGSNKEALPEPTRPAAEKSNEAAPVAVVTAPSRSNSMSSTAEDIALSGSFAGNKGRLPFPVDKGSVVSSFGEHPHAEFQNIRIRNNGIDIQSAPGSQARVVYDGEVSSVMFITNLNYVVIVRHGDYLTVYSNLQDVSVKKGDKVKTRQVLGTVVTAPGEAKPRLHFELWQGTLVLDPALWLKG
jgi:murein hydrolase activator